MTNQQFNRADMSRHAAAKAFQNSDSHVAAAMLIDVEYSGVFAELERLRLKNKSSLANNLCPDHRDKQAGKPCLACEIERLQQQVARLTEDAERYRAEKVAGSRSSTSLW